MFHFHVSISSLLLELNKFNNLEIENTLAWVLPNIWRLWGVGNTKFGTNASNKMLKNAAKCQGYNFHRFTAAELLRETQEEELKSPSLAPTSLD